MLKREVRRDNQSKYAIGHKQLPHFTPKNTILRGYRRIISKRIFLENIKKAFLCSWKPENEKNTDFSKISK